MPSQAEGEVRGRHRAKVHASDCHPSAARDLALAGKIPRCARDAQGALGMHVASVPSLREKRARSRRSTPPSPRRTRRRGRPRAPRTSWAAAAASNSRRPWAIGTTSSAPGVQEQLGHAQPGRSSRSTRYRLAGDPAHRHVGVDLLGPRDHRGQRAVEHESGGRHPVASSTATAEPSEWPNSDDPLRRHPAAYPAGTGRPPRRRVEPGFARLSVALAVPAIVEGEQVEAEGPEAGVVGGSAGVGEVARVAVADEQPAAGGVRRARRMTQATSVTPSAGGSSTRSGAEAERRRGRRAASARSRGRRAAGYSRETEHEQDRRGTPARARR